MKRKKKTKRTLGFRQNAGKFLSRSTQRNAGEMTVSRVKQTRKLRKPTMLKTESMFDPLYLMHFANCCRVLNQYLYDNKRNKAHFYSKGDFRSCTITLVWSLWSISQIEGHITIFPNSSLDSSSMDFPFRGKYK